MGREIRDKEYTAKDYEKFNRRIHNQVYILKEVKARSEFGRGQNCIGAELDMYFDNQMQEQPISVWECCWK